MVHDRVLKIILVVVGLLFVAGIYPLIELKDEEALQMMLSLYVTLGVFLLLAARNPSRHRSLIAFTAWSSFAHAAVMVAQSIGDRGAREHLLIGSLVLVIIGIPLIAFAPARVTMAEA